ncbi:hypothetical protein [Anaeromicrobium sediminis]|uniref:Phosphoglyceromutase n=1 Tax=Anaeromicrobium sediminis TaxID=1478221 RepID=A0A267MMV3_9FIRM|nr:hypothetical protein [Anaeromicrobium sediminis]PAB60924.1 hypothetical protein CCE28_00380 [Anaeromicrobium sediminis]
MKNKILISCLLVFMLAFFNGAYGEANKDKKVVMFVTTYMNFHDLETMDSTNGLINTGSIGLMNARAAGSYSIHKSYLTIGTGTRADASSGSFYFQKLDEDSKEIYELRTGRLLSEDGGIINLDQARLEKINENGDYGAQPGALGEALHKANKKTAIIGNLDISNELRIAPSITMDKDGYTDFGTIDKSIFKQDLSYPFGIREDYGFMKSKFKDFYQKADFIVVEIGDLYRLESYKSNMTNEAYMNKKRIVLENIDNFMKECISEMNLEKDEVIILNPYPSQVDMRNGQKLTPIILAGNNIKKGIVYSNTTRRKAIVGNVDVAAHVLSSFQLKAEDMSGKDLISLSKDNNMEYVEKLYKDTVLVSKNRYPVLSTFAVFEIVISLLGLMLILFKDRISNKGIKYYTNILLSTMAVPVVLLLIPLFGTYNIYITYVLVIGGTILLTLIAKKLGKEPLDGILILASATTIFLMMDICTGATLIKKSLLGYDPIIGARYYGIGNEFMGVLIGSSLVFATALLDRFSIKRIHVVAFFTLLVIIMGFPKLGANVGGTITAICAFIFVTLRLYDVKIKLKHFLIIGVSVVVIVGILAYIDIKVLNGGSHLGRAVMKIIKEGPVEVIRIINRKISMNLRLIGITIWSKVLISTILIIGVLFYRPTGTISRLSNKYPNLTKGFSGIVCACIVAFLVNDSGVVAAATGIIFLGMSILYLIFYMGQDRLQE